MSTQFFNYKYLVIKKTMEKEVINFKRKHKQLKEEKKNEAIWVVDSLIVVE